jgi:hypothetical protein
VFVSTRPSCAKELQLGITTSQKEISGITETCELRRASRINQANGRQATTGNAEAMAWPVDSGEGLAGYLGG